MFEMKHEVLEALRGGRPGRVPYWGDGSFVLGDYPGRRPPRSGVDAWGVTWAPLPSDYVVGSGEPAESFPIGHPAENAEQVSTMTVPGFAPLAKFPEGDWAVIAQHPAGPLDRFLTLLGVQGGYLALGREPGACSQALKAIAQHHIQAAREFLAAGACAGFVADDYAGQAGPVISPRQWRAVVLPAVAAVLEVYRNAGAPVIFHTCGRAEPFVGELIDAGATAFNVQSEVIDVLALKRQYGQRIAFYGGVATDIMLRGSADEIRAAVCRARNTLGREGGLVLAPDQPLAYSQASIAAFAAEAAKSVS
jgi:hypothetical protein